MNFQMIRYILGRILLTEAGLLVLPMLIALGCAEKTWPFLAVIGLLLLACLAIGGRRRPENTALYAKDGFVVVALTWLFTSAFGALPFVFSGDIPSYVDAFFETVSGFTTTGATILTVVEDMSRSGLFWRSFTHWIGGMGVLVFVMAILPMSDGHGMHVLRAEMPGPSAGKLVSRMNDTAKILYGIYFVLTIALILLLRFGGMTWFDACVHAFGTAGTGGFSSRGLSIGAYGSAYFDIVITVFMLLFGVNFNIYYFLLIKRWREALASEELRAYFLIVLGATAAITVNIAHLFENAGTALRHAAFQVASIMTTTGYTTANFDEWPVFSRAILVTLMFIGACAGSTGGGIKVVRVVTMLKTASNDLKQMIHPNAVLTVRVEGKALPQRQVRGVQGYLAVYVLIFTGSVLLLSLNGFDLVTTFTAVASCINNIGPGLALVGPLGNFAEFSAWSKLLLSFDMLVGRLEIFPMLLVVSPALWQHTFMRRRRE
ncbi:MAG: TrkH family potassium uptake protein [Oscillibacter sp.]|nr:TrkH family potassium uptake protein [Oscillibacter sp.]